jgi:hypothetical protein
VVVTHAIAGLAALLVPGGSLILRLLLGMLVLLSARQAWRRHVWRSAPTAVTALELRDDGTWCLERRDGGRSEPRDLAWAYVQTWILILGWRGDPWGRDRVVLLRDALPDDELRRLAVQIRLQPPGRSPDPPGEG